MTWPEVREELSRGRTTVVVPFGAVEQHGPHLPLGTDAIFGDEIGLAVAERLDAFLAPTVRVGFSPHHMAFAGTLTVDEETFHAVARSIVRALAGHGFRRIVLLPTHGGNFPPLPGRGDAAERVLPRCLRDGPDARRGRRPRRRVGDIDDAGTAPGPGADGAGRGRVRGRSRRGRPALLQRRSPRPGGERHLRRPEA